MIASILAIVGAALSIWASKEKTKYIDEMIAIKKAAFDFAIGTITLAIIGSGHLDRASEGG